MKITRFEDIEAWQLARSLANEIYVITADGVFSRDHELKNQIRSAAGSVMHNIAEGFDSGSRTEFVRFLRYSKRSCTEIQSELYLALDQKYVDEQQFSHIYEFASRTRSVIGGFIKYLSSCSSSKSQTSKR